MKQTK